MRPYPDNEGWGSLVKLSCIYESSCEQWRLVKFIFNYTSVRYRTVTETTEEYNKRGNKVTEKKIRDIMDELVKSGYLIDRVLDKGGRGIKPVGYRNARMMKKIRR